MADSLRTSQRVSRWKWLQANLARKDHTVKLTSKLGSSRVGHAYGCKIEKDGHPLAKSGNKFAIKAQSLRPPITFHQEFFQELLALLYSKTMVESGRCVNFPLSIFPFGLADWPPTFTMDTPGRFTTLIPNELWDGDLTSSLRRLESVEPVLSAIAQSLMGLHTMNSVWKMYHNDLQAGNILVKRCQDQPIELSYTFSFSPLVKGDKPAQFVLELRNVTLFCVLWDFAHVATHRNIPDSDIGQLLEWLKDHFPDAMGPLIQTDNLVDYFGDELIEGTMDRKTVIIDHDADRPPPTPMPRKAIRRESPKETHRRRKFRRGLYAKEWEVDHLEELRTLCFLITLNSMTDNVYVKPKGPAHSGHIRWGILAGHLLAPLLDLEEDQIEILRDEDTPLDEKWYFVLNTFLGMDEEVMPEYPLDNPITSTITPWTRNELKALEKSGSLLASIKQGDLPKAKVIVPEERLAF